MFSSNAVFAYPCDDGNGGDNIQHEGQDFNDHDETNPREETDEHKNEAHADDDSTYRYSWQLQLQPSLPPTSVLLVPIPSPTMRKKFRIFTLTQTKPRRWRLTS